MRERARLISALRSEIMGPEMPGPEANVVANNGGTLDASALRTAGALFWLPTPDSTPQEILHYRRESPGRKYGVGRFGPRQ